MTDAERMKDELTYRKVRNLERLRGDDEMQMFGMFLAASMAGGKDVAAASKEAAKAIDLLVDRFT